MIRTEMHEGIAVIAMDRPPANALNTAMVIAIREAWAQACTSDAQVIVLRGREGMFSAGLDVPELLGEERQAIRAFWLEFFRLTHALVTSPLPVVAALGGHAPAGGAVLAMHTDYRIAARGNYRIGLNEVAVGLPVPDCIMLAFEQLVGSRKAQRLAMTAELVTMDQALELGLVDELVDGGELQTRVMEWARQLAALPPLAMNRTRLLARRHLASQLRPEADAELATELWFSAETQAGMHALVERLASK